MKKIIFTLIIAMSFVSCAFFGYIRPHKVRLGMTREEVRRAYGSPHRVLQIYSENGVSKEIVEYMDVMSNIYVLEFTDAVLTELYLSHVKPETIIIMPPL